ncbi:MAG: phosphoenolpyruvate--protein phosphotransferase [Parvularculaceae bacterium]
MSANDDHGPPVAPQSERNVNALFRAMHTATAAVSDAQARLDTLTRVIASHIVADVCSIYVRRPGEFFELYATEGLKQEAVHVTRLHMSEGLVGHVARRQEPLVTAEAPLHPDFVYRPETGEEKLHSFLGVPLIRSARVLGVLVLQNKVPRIYTDEEVGAALAVAGLLAEIAASGELLGKEETASVGEVLRLPDRIEGTPVVSGVAYGRATLHDAPLAHHRSFAVDKGAELERLEDGLQSVRKSVDDLLADEGLSGVSREVLEAYRLFAYDRGWKERLRTHVFAGLTAEAAVDRVKAENRARLSQARDPYLRERLHDLDDLSHRLLRHLSGEATARPRALTEPSIVVAHSMGPADLLEYDRALLKGLVLVEASEVSHAAIVARALEIPMVSGADGALERIFDGDRMVADGDAGEVHIRPTDEIFESYRVKRELLSKRQAQFAEEKGLPSVTPDGVAIDLLMNAGLALDMPHLETTGAAGVGLYRTELQFLIGNQLPRYTAQAKLYADILDQAGGRPVIFRTADLGGDKAAAYMQGAAEGNPAMGWRGLRLSVDRPGILRPQLRALLAAAAERELHLMFPMVTLASEIEAAREVLDKEMALRRRWGRPLPSGIKVGAMIETPAAAWRVEEIAAVADFLSIGGNDLAQFYFAADRESPAMQRRFDPIDAGFLSFLQTVVSRAGRIGRPLTYCGEQAADPIMASALIGIGVRRFSLPATSIGWFRRLVRSLDAGEFSDWLGVEIAASRRGLREAIRARLEREGVALPQGR